MTTSFLNAETLRRSLYAQFKCVFWLITIFVVLAAGPAIVLTEQSTGSGGAINVSGSLRMMSYKLTVAVSNPYATYQERDKATRDAVKEFGTRLESPSLTASVPLDAKNHIRELYELVHKRFSDEVSPLAFESIDSEAARRAFLLKVPGFVDDVDRFVFALEESLSWRLTLLKVCLFITLAGAIALTFIMLSVMRRKVFAPLEELEATAERVRQKNFTARSKSADSSNEIGRFAKSFNFMVSELERLYGSLESEVARTTADLHRRNRGLEFLARASEDLMVDGPSLAGAVSEVLKGAVELAEARSAVFYVAKNREQGWTSETGYLFAKTIGWADAIGSSEFAAHGSSMTLVGMMKVEFGEVPDAWRRNFFEMTASLIGRAVEAVLRVTDEQRLAVLEERSTIARELHDSIAQSLSFSKIQFLDLNMKGSSGVEILATLKERDPSQRVVILTVSDSGEDFFSCIRAGADGYFLKDMEPEKVLYCVRESLEGRLTVDPAMVRYLTDLLRGKAPKVEETVSLTDREEDVLSCIARGMTNKMIGRELKISDGTVKSHVKHLLKKLGFNSRVEAAVWAVERTEKQKRQT